MNKPSDVMLGMLRDFDRRAIKARGESGDLDGFVLRTQIDHYDQRRFNALLSRGLVEYFKRCGCEGPCFCAGNGWHITQAGRAALEAR